MSLRITSRHFDLLPSDRDYIEKKMQRFRRLFDRIDEFSVTLEQDKRGYSAEVSVRSGKLHGLVKERGGKLREVIDRSTDTVFNQLSREKKKRSDRKVRAEETIRTAEPALEAE